MSTYIVRRLLLALAVLLLSTLIIFIVMRVLPGDPVLMYMTQDQIQGITPEALAAARHELGLDKPIIMQYFEWLSSVARGDLGKSILNRRSVMDELRFSLPISLHVGVLAWVLSHAVGIPVGVICAVRRGKWADTVLTVIANLGITAPGFWVGILLILLFGFYLDWLPTHGYTSPLDDLWLSTRKIILPVFCLSLASLSATVRQTRSAMLEVIQQDYVRTARAKGLRETTITMRHAVKNGIIPVVTLAGMSIPHILGGQVIIETMFTIPGMGSLAVSALFSRDYAITQGVVLIMSAAVVLCNLAVDISYSWLDPRVHYD